MKNLLPEKLSDCIDVALKDLDAAKKAGMTVRRVLSHCRHQPLDTVRTQDMTPQRSFQT